jgi:NhaP-type Na+/H+ or K+/H+ antiporter
LLPWVSFLFGLNVRFGAIRFEAEMDQILFILFVAAVGFAVGYAVRASISHHRREKAKRSRKFFDDTGVV